MASAAPSALPLAQARRLCTSSEMQAMDAHAIQHLQIPARVLMENAAHGVAAAAQELAAAHTAASIVVCCGRGNNGGDGYAAARLLVNRGLRAAVVALGEPGSEDARANRSVWAQFGATCDFHREPARAAALLGGADVIVDALFGTGLLRPLEGEAAQLIELINAAPAPVKLAVDLPSGVDADTGRILGVAVRATHTVTLQVPKVGLYQPPGADCAGRVSVLPISIPSGWPADAPATYLVTEAFARALLPRRPRAGHKGTFGHVLSVCGSAGMGGAAVLAGLGALKAGTGLVTLGVPRALRDRFIGLAPELMTLASEAGGADAFEPAHLEEMLTATEGRSAAVLGCGFGRRTATGEFARGFASRCPLPLLIDADGLYHMQAEVLAARPAPTVMTPHPGELSRLAGIAVEDLSGDRVGHARRLAQAWGVVLVCKGSGTVIAAPDGSAFINPTGDDGLATAGTGDVLSGIVGGFMAQRLPPLHAAILGVYVHGLARDLAREHITGAAFSASDLLLGINRALLALGK